MNEAYMYQNRFATNMGGFGIGNRFGHGMFQGPSSAQYIQFHVMKAQMPSDVLELFKANQVGFLKAPQKLKCRSIDPILTMKINLMEMFQIPNLQLMEQEKPQTRQQRLFRIAEEKKKNNQYRISQQIKQWNPFSDQRIQTDPQKTLFVSRLNYETTQKTLKFQFEKYGIIKKVIIIKDKNGKSRGYGFIQFDSKQDFLNAYKQGNNRKIDGKRVVVDYQRGRTVLNWRPRRLGGGKGQTRLTKQQFQQHKKEQLQKKNESKKQKKHQSPKRQRSRSRSRDRKQRKKQNYDERDRKYGGSRDQQKDKQRERQRQRQRQKERQRQRQRDRKDKKDRKDNNRRER